MSLAPGAVGSPVEPAAEPPPRRPRRFIPVATVLLPVFALASFVGLWWLACVALDIRSFLLPTPPEVVTAFLRLPRYLLAQLWVTAEETLAGFGIAVVAGLTLATLLAAARWVERAVMPVLVAMNAVPKLAIAPLLIVWMGFDLSPKIVSSILVSIFPIVVSAATGLTATPAELGELATSLTASRWQTFIKVRVPWALPHVFVGLKLAITLAVVGAVVGEFSGADQGLGFVIVASGQQADTALAFAAITLLGLLSVTLFYLVVAVERLALPWHRSVTA